MENSEFNTYKTEFRAVIRKVLAESEQGGSTRPVSRLTRIAIRSSTGCSGNACTRS